ncbi:MAG TPA: SDR family oxidoreductase [Acidimicrobiales bacterium]|nr:SDR family oxidoreductase [Acidimicrobiales bacterium]
MRTVVIGASSGLGRCVAVALAARGDQVAMLARRKDRLDEAAAEGGPTAVAIECDVTDAASCTSAVEQSAEAMGGIDAMVYTTGIGVLRRIEELSAEDWTNSFATNVIGASIATAAALPFLKQSQGTAAYFSSISASMTPPWPGLAAYVTSKAALDKLVEAWHTEHPEVGFTRITVGDCGGGEGPSATGFADGWDRELAGDLVTTWYTRGYIAGALIDVDELVDTVSAVLHRRPSARIPSVVVVPRLPLTE